MFNKLRLNTFTCAIEGLISGKIFMIEKILNGEYVARLIKTRLCDVLIWVSNPDGTNGSREQIDYDEYEKIEHLLK